MFLVYGIVSEIYRPVPERFKNYVSMPKKNGYRSLHTTVIANDGKKVEIQIRTREMHDFAERGVAAHFRYKASTGATASWVDSSDLEEWANWVRDIFESAGEEAAEQLLESFKLNLYQDEIYVFTPQGELRILPKGATPIDFAFDIHSEVGAHCIGAKVNGRIVPLDHKLVTGDQVEILTSRNQSPHQDWIKTAVTHKARTHIRRILNEERRQVANAGKEAFEKKAKKAGLTINDDELQKAVTQLKYDNRTEFYIAIGSGTLDADKAVKQIIQTIAPQSKDETDLPETVFTFDQFSETARDNTNGISIVGDRSSSGRVMFSYARCCNPVPGDDIIGLVTIGSGIKVHRSSCHNVKELTDKLKPRIVELTWSNRSTGEFLAAVKITGDDRAGMLNDITSAVLSVANTNIRGVNIDAFDSLFEGILTVYVTDTQHLEQIFQRLKKIKGVHLVERFEG
jgi:GTP diphosphokinase / guanosine-3',5'-bis(diphosphate) 3'-diphosphatase